MRGDTCMSCCFRVGGLLGPSVQWDWHWHICGKTQACKKGHFLTWNQASTSEISTRSCLCIGLILQWFPLHSNLVFVWDHTVLSLILQLVRMFILSHTEDTCKSISLWTHTETIANTTRGCLQDACKAFRLLMCGVMVCFWPFLQHVSPKRGTTHTHSWTRKVNRDNEQVFVHKICSF